MTPWLQIVGIGEDGWPPLAPAARQAIAEARHLHGASRHLALIPTYASAAIPTPWPSPMAPAIAEILAHKIPGTTVLASGDPMLHGIGVTLTRHLQPQEYRIHPSLSAFTLACARLGWPAAETTLISLVNRPVEHLTRHLAPNQRLIVYSEDATTPRKVATLLTQQGFSPSTLQILSNLGGPNETLTPATSSLTGGLIAGHSDTWSAGDSWSNLNLIALICHPTPGTTPLSLVPGLPDHAFETDGQFTKREVRAATLARLAPLPGETLWDVGAGTGTIAIEWLRQHPANAAIAFEVRSDRAARITANAANLGVPNLRVIEGAAPTAFLDLPAPDAIFIGGGLTPALFEAAWHSLPPAGRLVINAVTLDSEATLINLHRRYGGDLTRLQIARAELVGGLYAWRQLMPITQWSITKP